MPSSTSQPPGASTLTVVASTLSALAASAVVYRSLSQRWRRNERSKLIVRAIKEQWHESGHFRDTDLLTDDEDEDASTDSDEEAEVIVKKDETLPSIWEHFKDFQLDFDCSIDEANKRRTTKYYELARDAHLYDLCPGVRSYPRLRNRREAELKRVFRYHHANLRHPSSAKSHRTVIVMCDSTTTDLLGEARSSILEPLQYSHDITTSNVWIPAANV